MSNVRDAKRVLDQWKTSYFEMRAEIEASGSYSRWEFDRRKLFERTDYMASICQDLHHVLQVSVSVSLNRIGFVGREDFSLICAPQVMEEFRNIFGFDLKAVTGDICQIEEVLCRVDGLSLPFEDIVFNPFDFYKISSWKMIMQDFYTSVKASMSSQPKIILFYLISVCVRCLCVVSLSVSSLLSQHLCRDECGKVWLQINVISQ